MYKPVIGITSGSTVKAINEQRVYPYCQVSREYVSAIEHAGGLPLIIPVLETPDAAELYLEVLDGLLLSGGGDVSPEFFGEEPHPRLGSVDVERDLIEIFLARAALDRDIPVFGICRGIQLMNVAAGGSIYQDISQHSPNVLKHSQTAPAWYGSHVIDIAEDSVLLGIFEEKSPRVNSYHHQAVKDMAAGFVLSATSRDGIVEAMENPNRKFAVGVQFHPELMWRKNDAIARLFRRFVESCR